MRIRPGPQPTNSSADEQLADAGARDAERDRAERAMARELFDGRGDLGLSLGHANTLNRGGRGL